MFPCLEDPQKEPRVDHQAAAEVKHPEAKRCGLEDVVHQHQLTIQL